RQLDAETAAAFRTIPALAVDHHDRVARLHAKIERAEAIAIRRGVIARAFGHRHGAAAIVGWRRLAIRILTSGVVRIAVVRLADVWIARIARGTLIGIRTVGGRLRRRLFRRARRQRLEDSLEVIALTGPEQRALPVRMIALRVGDDLVLAGR